jgi:acyl-CoA thioester hydrolase
MRPESSSEVWPVAVDLPVLWGDMDALGHVNNTVYLKWFESARVAYFERIELLGEGRRGTVGPILASARVDFRIPVVYPDVVTARARAVRLGNTSFTLAQSVSTRTRGGRVAAEGEVVIVLIDYATGEKTRLPDPLRAAIALLEGREFDA